MNQEQNDVLQFLLGKTDEIIHDKNYSIISTNTSTLSITADSIESVSLINEPTPVSDDLTGNESSTESDLWNMPEMEPICDTDSEDEVIKKVSPGPTPNASLLSIVRQSLLTKASFIKIMIDSSVHHGKIRNFVRKCIKILETNRLKSWITKIYHPDAHVSSEQKLDTSVTITDLLLLIAVTFTLVVYCFVIVYRFIYPIEIPLPDSQLLYTPWDVSNVSLRIISPTTATPCIRRGQPLEMEWEFVNFPAAALRQYGSEPFEYRVLLNNKTISSEVGFWLRQDAQDSNEQVLNKTFKNRYRAREMDAATAPLPGYGEELRLQVSFPIPGSDGEIRTLEQRVTCRPPSALTIQRIRTGLLEILKPQDAAEYEENESILVEYIVAESSRFNRVQVVVDNQWIAGIRDVKEGNILLRGLGVGLHTLELQALDQNDNVVVARALRITVLSS